MANVPTFRPGQFIRFELDEQPKLVVLRANNQVDLLAPEDPMEVEVMKRKFAKAADGRFVGIHVPAARSRLMDGDQERWVVMPAQIVPLRAILGTDGSHHVTHAVDGRAVNVSFTLDSLRNLEAVLLQEDLPAYRRETCNPDWQPRR